MRSEAPAPCGRQVVEASRSTTIQCHQPDGVGASGSKQDTAKEAVPSGKPDHDRSGERLSPAAAVKRSAMRAPAAMSVDSRVNAGTAGSRS